MQPTVLFADSYFCAEQVGQDWGGEEFGAGAVGYDAALLHEDDAFDFRWDVVEVVGDQDQAGALSDEAAHAFAEVALGGEVEGVAGLVEQELAGAVDEGAGDEDAAFFSGGHFADEVVGEVGGVDAFESFGGAEAHLFGDDEVGPERGGGEEAGDDGVEAGGASGGAAGGVGRARGGVEAGVGVGDDSEVVAEFGQVPAAAAEDAHFGAGRAVVGNDGVELAVHGADEGGFAAAVGAEDGDVFAGLDGEVDVVEDNAVAEGYVDVAHVQEVLRTLDRFAGFRAGLGCYRCHLIC